MSEEGVALPAAITAAVFSPDSVTAAARYQARKLVQGDTEGFAERCGEYVRNEALRSLNETIIANVERDAPQGVYHSRETAGEMRRFHRGCDCKIVPGLVDDPDAILVEGHDPIPVDYSENPMSEYGRLVKEGGCSRENIVDRKNEWRDLFAHHVLSESGFKVETRDGRNLDLLINGEPWEVKSPDEPKEKPKEGRELSYIESNLRNAAKQFKKRGIESVSVVFNNKYRDSVCDIKAEIEVEKRTKQHRIDRVIFIRKDGAIRFFE